MGAKLTPTSPWCVASVEARPGFRLWVRFKDGREGEVVLNELIHSENAGVFAALRNESRFRQVHVRCGVVTWPGELDLAPDAMYESILKTGRWIVR
ncbi:MAG: DUF2442 domain-containing protein [Methylohalobius crimeensis]